MATPHAQHLKIVTEQGEVVEEQCPNCAGAEKEVRAWRMRYANLKREVDNKLEGHELFPQAKRLFDHYKYLCRHPHHRPPKKGRCPACARTKFTIDRFNEIKPRLLEHGDEAEELCRRAIEGAAYDPFVTRRKNGTFKYHNEWHQIFAADKFQEFCNKAPYHLAAPEHVHALANALLFLNPKWEIEEAVAEAMRRLNDEGEARRRLGWMHRKNLWLKGE